MAEGRDKDRKLDELEKRHQKLKQRRQQWEEKNNLKPLPSQVNNTNRTNSHESPPQEPKEENESFDAREFAQSTITYYSDLTLKSKQGNEIQELSEKFIADAKKMNSGLSHKKALIIAGASCSALSGWIAYKNKHRFIEHCNRISTKKVAKTIFYLGCGSAIFVAGLYGYKKISNVFNTPIKKNEEPKIIIVQSDIDDTPRYQERAQEIRDKYKSLSEN